jgi:hypothetical protein
VTVADTAADHSDRPGPGDLPPGECAGITKAGGACRAIPPKDEPYCKQHQWQADGSTWEDRDQDGPGDSQATRLVQLAEDRYTLHVTISGTPFAVAQPGHGPHLARMLRGGRASLRAELASMYVDVAGRVPSSGALADALLVLEGRAAKADPVDLALRVAAHDGSIILDLGDPTGRVVVISPAGWEIVDRSPVLFRRTELTGVLPTPERGGSLDELRDLLNVTDDSWPLLRAWLVAALFYKIPHPILLLGGEQGAGKTTAEQALARMIDPSGAQVRTAPRDVEQWAVAAAGSWIVPLDNVSTISEWLSDSLCKAVTGDGVVRRLLYENDALSVLAFRRVVMMSSIDAGSLRGDLGERLLIVDLERIDPARRRRDEEVTAAFAAAHPRMLGALLDLAARTLAELPAVKLDRLPRMADFAVVVAGVDRVCGSEAFKAYEALTGRIAEEVIEGDQIAQAVLQLLDDQRAERLDVELPEWSGTASALLKEITPDKPPKGWPESARGLAGVLRRAATALRTVGVDVTFGRQPGGRRQRTITLRTRQEIPREQPSRPSHRPEGAADQRKQPPETGTVPGTVGQSAIQPSHPTVPPTQTSDQRKQQRRDGRDGRDGKSQPPSADPGPHPGLNPAGPLPVHAPGDPARWTR